MTGKITSNIIKVSGSNHYFDEKMAYWVRFWQRWGIDNPDFNNVEPFSDNPGFNPLVLPKHDSLTPQYGFNQCKERFDGAWKWTDASLDSVVTKNDRDPRRGAYVVWFRDAIEADEELKNLSAVMLEEMKIPGITLLEREVMEDDCFERTGGHLDLFNITSCTGSRYDDGDVPNVCWLNNRMSVYGFGPRVIRDGLHSRQTFTF